MTLSSFEHPKMSKVTQISNRKADHIRITLNQDVQSSLTSGLEQIQLEHNALPELDIDDITLSTKFLNKDLERPILISSMTGGTQDAQTINATLAEAAQARGIAMGLGSQRATLEDPGLRETFQIRSYAPDILLFANLGAVQLNYGYGVDECKRIIEDIQADALFLHLNPLQEALQPEGDTNFGGLLKKIEKVCAGLAVPVVAKEVGWGISADVASRLVNCGISAIDLSGAGGTSWSQVEMHRAQNKHQQELAAAFTSWGIPTAKALLDVRAILPEVPIIASGGLRTGIDMAKCIALGADLCGVAGPFLRAATESTDAVIELIDLISAQLRVSMFATGSANLESLQEVHTIF
jgi:isopentenyl-diphosphate delta-isomerase